MCGIVGGWWRASPGNLENNSAAALRALSKRGPDDKGFDIFSLNCGTLGLGHTRLAIIDLSSAGHQPMRSADGRYTIVFNGEIYNYRELRQTLVQLGHSFVSDSDTEVLLAAWAEWQRACLAKLDGMFAFCIYDRHNSTLTCARDAFGIKPFFYQHGVNRFVFASEQAALLALRAEPPKANWQRAYDYLVHGDYDSTDATFIKDVQHLLPGCVIGFDMANGRLQPVERWWTPKIEVRQALSFSQAVEATREQFLQNIRLQLRSDVPLGAALSGGIDSSAVVCAMRHVEPDLPINTFSYIATGSDVSEERWVDCVNSAVGAHAHKITADGADLAADLDTMITAQGEPFGSTSIYAQYRVFQLARERGITVTLDGQGADELLAGYSGYPGYRLLSLLETGEFIRAQRFAARWAGWPGRTYSQAWMHFANVTLPDTLHRVARRYLGRNAEPTWLRTGLLRDADVHMQEHRYRLKPQAKGRRVVEQLADALQRRGLPHLLRHGDRNAMQFSIESRVPFLNIAMADLMLSMPEDYLVSPRGETKHVFRAAMRGIVPDIILDRKDKIGFATPEKSWLLGMAPTIRTWLHDSDAIPFLDREALLQAFDRVAAHKSDFTWQVWRWVNFVRWYHNMGVQS